MAMMVRIARVLIAIAIMVMLDLVNNDKITVNDTGYWCCCCHR